jgi:hypothetical protein
MRNADKPQFRLAFESMLIPKLAARYSFEEDTDALSAGADIRSGAYTRQNLERIFEWKTNGRGRSRLRKNSDAEIAEALTLSTSAQTDRCAVAVLMGLNGVRVPVASAVVTAINPERFTIVDFRALEALGVEQPYISIDFYLAYLDACRGIACENNVALRTLDRALWQWSKESGEG